MSFLENLPKRIDICKVFLKAFKLDEFFSNFINHYSSSLSGKAYLLSTFRFLVQADANLLENDSNPRFEDNFGNIIVSFFEMTPQEFQIESLPLVYYLINRPSSVSKAEKILTSCLKLLPYSPKYLVAGSTDHNICFSTLAALLKIIENSGFIFLVEKMTEYLFRNEFFLVEFSASIEAMISNIEISSSDHLCSIFNMIKHSQKYTEMVSIFDVILKLLLGCVNIEILNRFFDLEKIWIMKTLADIESERLDLLKLQISLKSICFEIIQICCHRIPTFASVIDKKELLDSCKRRIAFPDRLSDFELPECVFIKRRFYQSSFSTLAEYLCLIQNDEKVFAILFKDQENTINWELMIDVDVSFY